MRGISLPRLALLLSTALLLSACGGDGGNKGGDNTTPDMGGGDMADANNGGNNQNNNNGDTDANNGDPEDSGDDTGAPDLDEDTGAPDMGEDLDPADLPEDLPPEDLPGEDDFFNMPDLEDDTEAAPDLQGECSPEQPCAEGVCQQGSCVDATPCMANLECLDSAQGARVCAGCFEGHCQQGGQCRAACDADGQCGQGERCVDGGCAPWGEVACASDAACPGAQRCDQQAYVCQNAAGCATDIDCAQGDVCDNQLGVCVSCRSNLDCDGFQTCQRSGFGAVCLEPDRCSSDEDCQGLRICDVQSGRCSNALCQEDRFEPNNRINEEVQMLREGVYTQLRICGGEADLFLVTTRPDGPLWVRTHSQGGPAQIKVYLGGANPFDPQEPFPPLAESSGSEQVQGVLIPAHPQARTFLVHVTSEHNGIQDYDLEISLDAPAFEEPPCPVDEVGINPARATPLPRGEVVNAALCTPEGQEVDSDWFRVELPAGQSGELSVIYPGETGAVQLSAWQQEDGEVVQRPIEARPEVFGQLLALPAGDQAQIWLVQVSARDAAVDQSYLLDLALVEQVDCGDDLEPNNSAMEATALPFPEGSQEASVSGASVCAGDEDWYSLSAMGGAGLRVQILTQEGPGQPGVATLWSQDQVVATSQAIQGGLRLELGMVPEGGADYLLQVQPGGALPWGYGVTAQQVEAFCADNDALEPSDLDNPVPIHLPALDASLCAGEQDVYAIEVQDNERLSVSLEGPEGATFAVQRVDNGLTLIQNVRSYQERLSTGGQLRIIVSGGPQTQGAYVLRTSGRAPGPENDTCQDAAPLTVGELVTGTLSGADDSASSQDCFTLGGSPDVVYRLSVGRSGPLVVTLRPMAGRGAPVAPQPTLFVRQACADPATELSEYCADDFQDGTPGDGVVTLSRRFDTGDYFIWVDGTTDGVLGDFTLEVQTP